MMVQSKQIPSKDPWLHRAIRFVIFWLVRLFYPHLEIQGRENLPQRGPIIFVLNHPNGLIDPLILMIGLDRPISFLAKSTLFGNPVGQTFLTAFRALPIYRRHEDGLRGGPRGDAVEQNEITFAHCRALLRQGESLALFPEGTTHSYPELLPLRTGAARIALSAETEANWSLDLQVVPVGLWYRHKTQFRSSVLLVVGQPLPLAKYAANQTDNERQIVQAVTSDIEASLDSVVLQAENAELLAALPVVAAWTTSKKDRQSLAKQHEWTAQLLAAYKQLSQTDPDRLAIIGQQARRYAAALQTFGINDPWILEIPTANRKRLVWLVAQLILGFPFALGGFVLSYLPYRLASPIARLTVGKDTTQIGTIKIISGTILVLLAWLLEALMVGDWFGVQWGILLLLAALPLTYIALRWGEGMMRLQELLAGNWLRLRAGGLVQSLKTQRQVLAKQIIEAVQITST